MLAKEDTVFSLLLEKKKDVDFVFYGCTIIRNELRATPNEICEVNKSLRIHLLYLYDSLITKKNHNLIINEFVELLAKKYMEAYKLVNTQQGFRNPKCLHYNFFKRKILSGSDI